MQRSNKKLLLVFLFMFAVSVSIELYVNLHKPFINRIARSRATLGYRRRAIDIYRKIRGRFPVDPDKDLRKIYKFSYSAGRKEYISTANGNNSIHNKLDGTGGWYYNPKTGKLKINVTVPVSKCIPYYVGKYKNDIPADW